MSSSMFGETIAEGCCACNDAVCMELCTLPAVTHPCFSKAVGKGQASETVLHPPSHSFTISPYLAGADCSSTPHSFDVDLS